MVNNETIYNEIDDYAVHWLRALISEGHVAPGRVERTGIEHLRPEHIANATQAHFFAGIGVWSHALRLAGWPDDRPVWTGSCPCQPFSDAGSARGASDERHFWPAWFALIRECRPSVIFGEQVASKSGRYWLDAVSADLETLGYAVGSADLCAASVGAPHIRQRLFWVAIANRDGRQEFSATRIHADGQRRDNASRRGSAVGLGDSDVGTTRKHARKLSGDEGEYEKRRTHGDHSFEPTGATRRSGGLGDSDGPRPQIGQRVRRDNASKLATSERAGAATGGFWADAEWLNCSDGVARPVKPGLAPLAHGVAGRVGKLRGYGNAIVAPLAAQFVRSVMDLTS